MNQFVLMKTPQEAVYLRLLSKLPPPAHGWKNQKLAGARQNMETAEEVWVGDVELERPCSTEEYFTFSLIYAIVYNFLYKY